jgi:hypothetical protein
MRPGCDLVGVQAMLLEGPSYVKDWWREGKRSNLLIRDINGDGREDVFMAVEENPKIEDAQARPCEKPDREWGCYTTWGEREIEIHYQQPDGSYRLGARSRLMMNRDEGGMDPDPFKGFTITPKGSIRIHFSGGSGWVWEYIYTVQFRKNDVYVIGAYTYECNAARDDVECYKADANLLTGQWWYSTWIGDGKHHEVKKGKMKIRRTHRLKDAFPRMDPCAPPPRPDYDSTMHVLGGPQEGFSCDESTH